MLTSKVQLGYILTGGGGQAVQGGLSCPPPRISERIDNPQILLHHLLQEYLVEIDINIISINLRCSLQRFSWVMYWQGVGDKLSRAVYLAPRPEFQRELIIAKFYYTIIHVNPPGSSGSLPEMEPDSRTPGSETESPGCEKKKKFFFFFFFLNNFPDHQFCAYVW